MPLRDPVAVYNAATNLDAVLVREMLLAAGIEAHVVEDVSLAGQWMFGLLPEIHKPQVWVEQSDVNQVKPLLEEYDRRARSRHEQVATGPPIEVICEECGKRSSFQTSRGGNVENCPHCGAYIDVGDNGGFEEWGSTREDRET